MDSARAARTPALARREQPARTAPVCHHVNVDDVRDVNGRLFRLVLSIIVGATGAVMLGAVLPGHVGGGPSAFAIPALVAAGAVGITLGLYTLLGVLARRLPVPGVAPLPRARLVRRR